jgi:crotonobetainyl-CoA:carnitine CoA-transferase CaiB-like acyl-CoA transferase
MIDSNASADDAGILDGVRVLDFTAMVSGPYATRLMADIGAEVIKIEPVEGDYMRSKPPLRQGRSSYFGALNAGKKSLALDLKRPEAVALIKQLAAGADVLVENFRPGVMQRLGLGDEALAAINPRLVYCSISGFGQTGSWAGRSAYAPVLHAASGFDVATLGYQDGLERPLANGIFVADVLGGALAFGAVQAGLFKALRRGRGERIDLSLMDAMLGLMVYDCQEAQFPAGQRRSVYQPTQARDGFVLMTPISQNNFEALARAAGHAEWLGDPRFATAHAREDHWAELMALLDDWAATRGAADCEAAMLAAGVPCSRYVSVREAMRAPPVVERGVLQTVRDDAGAFQAPNPAFRFRQAPAHARERVPELGEHGAALLRELGVDDARIAALVEQGVLSGAR